MTFGPLTIHFDERVLRPRPWTLAQAQWGSELARTAGDGSIVELCAGVGHIGLAMARECADQGRPRALILVDADPHACHLARINASEALLPATTQVRHGRIDTAIQPDERFAVMLADPPWVPSEQTGLYPADPLSAIDGGDADGLDLARECVRVIGLHLASSGSSILQVGTTQQAAAIAQHVDDNGDLGLSVAEIRDVVDANGVLLLLTRGR